MATIQLSEPPADIKGLRPFGLGFRPFFLAAGAAALGLMLAWVWQWHRGVAPSVPYGPIGWHSHEMLFGYLVAVIAGFLLTAVRNWTGHLTPAGWPLAALAAVWLAARILPWVPATHPSGFPCRQICGPHTVAECKYPARPE